MRKAGSTFIGAIMGLWLVAALAFGYFEVARRLPFWGPPLVPLILAASVTILLLKVPPLWDAIKALDMRWLVATGFLRILVLYIVVLYVRGLFPGSFAIPAAAGVLVVVVGALLLFALAQPLESRGRMWLAVWNVVAFLQLLTVIGLVAGHIVQGYGQALSGFATLPLNLFPTFIVPFSLVAHILIYVRQRSPMPYP